MTCIAKASQQDFDDLRMMELAAKAAGLNVMAPYMPSDDIGWLCIMETGKGWSPLHDDGDALRLAVVLGMTVEIMPTCTLCECHGAPYQIGEQHHDDPMKSTRRAIVSAAASVGESMP